MMQNKIMQMLAIVFAVVLFAPVCEVGMPLIYGEDTNELNTPTDALQRIDTAELPQSNSASRHSIRRAVKRFNLRMLRPRVRKWLAVLRIVRNESVNYDENGLLRNPPKVEEKAAQCCVCGDKETVDSPLVIRIAGDLIKAQCVDCALDLQEHLATLSHSDQHAEMQSSAPFSAVIIGIFFAVCAGLIDPTMLSSVAFIGAVRRPLSSELKNMQNAGYTVRRVAKNRDTECHSCDVAMVHNGDFGVPQIQINVAGYKNKKPHCETCALEIFIGLPESPPAPTPSPDEVKVNRYDGKCKVCNVSVQAYEGRLNGVNVLCMAHAQCETKIGAHCTVCSHLVDDLGCGCTHELHGEPVEPIADIATAITATLQGDELTQLGALIQAISGKSMDEDKVKAIVQETTAPLLLNQTEFVEEAVKDLTASVQEQIDAINIPTRIELKVNSKKVALAGIRHYRTSEIPFSIVNAGAKNINLTGEAGTGKTHLIDQIHEALEASKWFKGMKVKGKRSAFIMSANKDMQAPELIGRESPRFFDDGSGESAGEWAFIRNKLLDNFEHGGVIGLDEMDRFSDSTLSALNAALANGFITTPKGERVLRHPAAIIIATGNTKGQGASPKYSAANKQDAATLDRFAMNFIDIDYDPAIENSLCKSSELVDAIREVRRLSEAHSIKGAVFSYRCIIEANSYFVAGCSIEWIMRRMVMAFGEESAIKLGYAREVSFDETLWGGA